LNSKNNIGGKNQSQGKKLFRITEFTFFLNSNHISIFSMEIICDKIQMEIIIKLWIVYSRILFNNIVNFIKYIKFNKKITKLIDYEENLISLIKISHIVFLSRTSHRLR
jgi:hypothetical protein